MKKKFDMINVAKIGGFLLTVLGTAVAGWASEMATKKQNDENFEKYISEKEKENEEED